MADSELHNLLPFAEILDNIDVGIALFDPQGNYLFVNTNLINSGGSLLAFEVYASYIKSVARSFYSQLLLLWIPMRTKFPLCFLSAFFLILFLFPFIQILSTFLV